MLSVKTLFMASALTVGSLMTPALVAPAAAAVNNQQPGPFVDTLADEAFAVLRTGNKAAAKARFRTLLAQHFAIDAIGDRLIRRWKPKLTPQQLAAYKAAFPNYIIAIYADRLFEYANADLKIVRTQAAGNGAAVVSQVTKKGAAPITAIWTVDKAPSGYRVSNMTVAGINLAVTQSAEFDSFIQRNGFDALVNRMKTAK